MKEFPLDTNEWYTIRDDRTKRVNGTSGFEDFSLGVIVDSRVVSVYAIQVMVLITLNILARWCRSIKVQMPTATISCLSNQKDKNLVDMLKQIMSNADPYGQFTFNNVEEDDHNQVLIIGQTERVFQKPHVWINGSGWIAGIAYGTSNTPFLTYDNNPIGPAFASCLGIAEIFRQAIGLPPGGPYSTWYSLYDFKKEDCPRQLRNPTYTSRFDFGRIHQVGCGAVGSSLDFLLSITNWKAEINLIDYDQVQPTDCNRSLLFDAYDAAARKNKVDACAQVLKSSRITPIIFQGSYAKFIKEGRFLDTPPDLILSLANEENVWADIQHNYPPLVFHATTTPNWGLNFGRHIPKKEWCIMCRFSKEINHKFIPQCSEGEIGYSNSDHRPIQGVLPFLSTASAILVLAEMAKMSLEDYPINKNFVEFSTKSRSGIFLQTQRKAESGCICNEQSVMLYPKEIQRSKFWTLVG